MIEGLKFHGPVIPLNGQVRDVVFSRRPALGKSLNPILVTSFTVKDRRVEFCQPEGSVRILILSEGDRVSLAGGDVDDFVLVDSLRLIGSRKVWGETVAGLVVPALLLVAVAACALVHAMLLIGMPALLAGAWFSFRAERQFHVWRAVKVPRRVAPTPLVP